MDIDKTIGRLRGAISVKRVFGEPVERDGTTVVPAALVLSGGGAGGASGGSEGEEGGGAGFGGFARPVGAYVIKDGEVTWKPSVDVTWIVLALIGVAMVLARALLRRS